MLRYLDTVLFAAFRPIILVMATVLLAAACGGSESAAETTTTMAATTATVEATAPTTGAAGGSFTETSDTVYMSINGADLLMDIYTPAGVGPWPVVVAFHGLDSHGKDEADTAVVAEAAAAAGMLVYAPSWIVWDEPGPFPFTIETFEAWKAAANCAVAFAQQRAADHGGDPTRTVVYGFSAGAGAALLATLEPSGAPIPACVADASPTPLAGVVLGDGEYFLHSNNFDHAFEADPAAMQVQVASLTDATRWPPDLNAKFFLWVADGGTSPRTTADPSDESGWLAQRDPDGSIRADLERLNQLEDGIISFIDAGQLLELRLSEAGLEVTLDEYPGGHTAKNKVPELVGYLQAAAAL